MWLRRQDELNEARPTERFSTAIRLLSGRAGMERRVAKARGETAEPATGTADPTGTAEDDIDTGTHLTGSVDVRGLAVPATEVGRHAVRSAHAVHNPPNQHQSMHQTANPVNPRAQVLARRRRTTTLLFVAFTAGAIAAAVGGIALLWAPAAPAVLLTLYIGQMRRQERRRYEFRLDQGHAVEAARRLRARPAPASSSSPDERERPELTAHPADVPPAPSPRTADRRALVEQTDHAEWVDQQRAQQAGDDGWDPVPVPLPTYVTAPVAPRTPGGLDPGASDTWSAARSGTTAAEPSPHRADDQHTPTRRPRPSRTPLFDQYADPDRPRAANE
jgi:hypothetical protein